MLEANTTLSVNSDKVHKAQYLYYHAYANEFTQACNYLYLIQGDFNNFFYLCKKITIEGIQESLVPFVQQYTLNHLNTTNNIFNMYITC